MGKSENANVSIGLKIKLGQLIEQINVENIEELKKIFSNGFIEDENDSFTSVFKYIYYHIYNEFFSGKKKVFVKKNQKNRMNKKKNKLMN